MVTMGLKFAWLITATSWRSGREHGFFFFLGMKNDMRYTKLENIKNFS